ncbi:TIM barrel protein [candidate division KSB1 bacterium]|nr:TIM barrel protein [candidate division KSB1 bacterium]
MNRRKFITTIAAAGSAMVVRPGLGAEGSAFQFNCFSKHLQWLDYKETAEVLKDAGYNGVDLTVRPGGHVEPERVEEDLPRAVETFVAAGLNVPMIVTSVTRADDPSQERTLRTAAALGVKIYRMGYLNYETSLGIEGSIAQLRPQIKELADFNRQIGITGAYQNHAGTRIGGAVWDLWLLLQDVAPQHLGIQYDIKHATAEGGRSWILGLQLVAEHINCLALKDFLWQQNDRGQWSDTPVPMGTGMVDYPAFFAAVKDLNILVPVTMHLEYKMPHQEFPDAAHAVKKAKEIEVYRRDLAVAREMMRKSGLI